MRKILLSTLAIIAITPCMQAQSEPQLVVAPAGRLHLDGAAYVSPNKEEFKDGLGITDVRLGVKAKYGKWQARLDIGYAYNKVGLKDIYLQYDFDEKNFVRGGSFIHNYGLQSAYGASAKTTYEEPMSNTAFNPSRHLGVMYVHNAPKYFAAFSAHVEPNSAILTPNQTNQQGYGVMTRLVYRPNTEPGNIFHVGISGGFLTPQDSGDEAHNVFSLNSNFPTSVVKVKAVGATINNAMNQWRFTPELLLSSGPLALEAQYFYNRVNMRHDLHNFTGMGGYAMLRGLLTGGNYSYSAADACVKAPGKGACEMVLCYNYIKLTDKNAGIARIGNTEIQGIYGGNANTISATLNYYINKYMLARLNYSYTHTFNGAPLNTDLNVIQARIQIIF